MVRALLNESVQAVIEFLPYPILIAEVTSDGARHLSANKGFEQEIGYTLDEIPTLESWYQKAYPDELYRHQLMTTWRQLYEDARQSGKTSVTSAALVQTKNNGRVWYEIKVSVGKEIDVVAFVNISKLMNKEEDMRTQLANQSRVLAVLSHDLRSPLVSFLAIFDLVKRQRLSQDELQNILQTASADARRVLDMVDSTVLWARNNFPIINVSKTSFAPRQIFEKYVATQRAEIDSKRLQVSICAADDLIVEGDPALTEILIRNMLSNAIKFSSSDGMIRIVLRSYSDTWQMMVEDNGKGIPPDELQRIREGSITPASSAQSGKGLGLGLRLCQDIANRLNAQFTIESESGKGTRVMIVFN